MQHSPNRFFHKKSKTSAVAKNRHFSAQHVSSHYQSISSSALQGGTDGATVFQLLPYETLCHVASYLDPPSLAKLSAVNRYLHEFISEDVIWKLALFANILDIHPEREHESPTAFLLRRLEPTWKAEYISRYNGVLHWSQSRTTYTAHNPLLIPVPNIHLLSDGESLLVAPEHFSWILRSIPSTGKILKGHFQPTLANQAHPANDWSPPSAGAIASNRASAKIAWGSQAGHVMVKTTQNAMDPKANQNTSVAASSLEDDTHEGFINHIAWATSPSSVLSLEFLVTAGEDGCVKLWNSETCAVAWTSPYTKDGAPIVRAEFDLHTKTVVALTESGDVIAWYSISLEGFPSDAAAAGLPVPQMLVARIPSDDIHRRIYVATTTLSLVCVDSGITAFVHVKGDVHVWCFTMDFQEAAMEMTRIDGPLGPITAVHLEPPTKSTESPILMVGDSLSQLSIYNIGHRMQNQLPSKESDANYGTLAPNLALTTHAFGAITAIASNRVVLLAGNDTGLITVWDAVTLGGVRTIDASLLAKDGVGVLKIVCSGQLVVASVGRSVLHWQTGELSKKVKVGKKFKTSRPKTRMEEYELAIKNSQAELEMTSKRPRPAAYTEQDQLAALRAMGIDEAGAVEYALMLSHDEALRAGLPVDLAEATELAKMASLEGQTVPANGQFTSSSSDTRSRSASISTGSATASIPGSIGASPSGRSWSGSAKGIREEFMPSSPWKSASMTKFSPPNPVGKVQISPPYRPEAIEVGRPPELSLGPALTSSSKKRSKKSWSEKSDGEEFPSLSAPPSAELSRAPSPPSARTIQSLKASSLKPGTSRSGVANRSQVRSPVIEAAKPSQTRPSWSGVVKSSPPPMRHGSSQRKGRDGWAGLGSARTVRVENRDEEEDRELQFVLELSRAEALSRGAA